MNTNDALLQQHFQELRRGSIVIAVLALMRVPQYGYALLQQLADRGFEVEANTLYPLLRRLENQKLMIAEWNTTEARPCKYYRTSDDGLEMLEALLTEWTDMNRRIESLQDQ